MLPWSGGILRAEEPTGKKARVWIAEGEPGQAAKALVEAVGGLEPLIPEKGTVLVKPNIGFATPPEWGATTDPEFLGAVLDLCVEAGAKRVIVIDHPVGSSPENNLKRSGIGAVCEARDAVQVLIAEEERFYLPQQVPYGKALKETEVAKILGKADLFINVPTAKHHSATRVSLGLKNLMGLIRDRVPFHQEMDLNQGIADLATVIRPQLTLLEARYALLTNGPTGPGQVEEVGKYLAGFDPVAVDSVGVGLAAWEGRIQAGSDVPHIAMAQEHGVGIADRDQIDLVEVS
jgi:uncharacterized protein (DUF362 family)